MQALRVASAQSAWRRRRLAVDVGDAEPAADDELGQAERGEERAEHLGRLLEGGRLEDLAPDVRMDAGQLDSRHELQGGHRLGAAPEETEKPNFESSCPVRTNSCVCASTPGVTRTRTVGRCAARRQDSRARQGGRSRRTSR